MGGTFALDAPQFTAQAPVFHSAGDELAAALKRLDTVLTTEGKCWGNDEPGRQFAKTYQPDASATVQNVRNLVKILEHTGSSVRRTADDVGNQDLEFGRNTGDFAAPDGIEPFGGAVGSPSSRTSNTAAPSTVPATFGERPEPAAPAPYRGAATSPETDSATTDPTNSPDISDPSSPGQPGAQQNPAAPQTGQQGSGDSDFPDSPTESSSPRSDPDHPVTEPLETSFPAAAEGEYTDSPPAAPVSSAGGGTGTTSSGNTPSMPRLPSAEPGRTAPRSPWSAGPMRRPAEKRKQDKKRKRGAKPAERPPRVFAPEDPEGEPTQGLPEVSAPGQRAARRRPASNPWSTPDALQPAPPRTPWKDAAHGTT